MNERRPPGVLVDGDWLESRLPDPRVIVLEVDEMPLIHRAGHIPGARNVDWRTELQDPVTRDLPTPAAMHACWRRWGIGRGSTVVLYGDKNNWYACFGYWLLRHYGLRRMAILDGGRQRWIAEGRAMTTQRTVVTPPRAVPRPATGQDVRVRWPQVLDGDAILIDVRTPAEYRGEILTEPGYADEGAQRPGHIPGAHSIPWDIATGLDGSFLPVDALRELYDTRGVLQPDRPIITYCRIGERSAHTWFVLSELLGVPEVHNYDGSWTEWGSMIGMPVAVGDDAGTMTAA